MYSNMFQVVCMFLLSLSLTYSMVANLLVLTGSGGCNL